MRGVPSCARVVRVASYLRDFRSFENARSSEVTWKDVPYSLACRGSSYVRRRSTLASELRSVGEKSAGGQVHTE